MKKFFSISLFAPLGVVLILSGCTMAPKYERPDSPVVSEYPGTHGINSGTNVVVSAADREWHTIFTDERLRHLIDLSLTNNRDLRVAILNVEQSRAQYRVTRSSLLPSVQAGGSYTRSHANRNTTSGWSASLGSTAYEIDFFGRVRSLNQQALEKYFATEEAQRSSQMTVVGEVATDYLTYRQTEAQLLLARETLASVQASYEVNKAMFEGGASGEMDLKTAEGQVESSKINIITYQRELEQARNALELVVGTPLKTEDLETNSMDQTNYVADIPAGLPSELIWRRPDILQAEHTLKAANANIGAARAAFFPSIKMTASVGTTSDQFSKLFGSGTGVWSFSPQVSVPIFTGGENKATLDASKVSKRIEIANYEKAIQTAFKEVSDALVAVGSYDAQIKEEEVLVALQQRRYDLARARYQAQEDGYINVLSAQQDLLNAQLGLIQARFNKLSSKVTLYKALGGGWK